MKMTFQPKKRSRSIGFQKSKGKKEIISIGRIYCGLFFYLSYNCRRISADMEYR